MAATLRTCQPSRILSTYRYRWWDGGRVMVQDVGRTNVTQLRAYRATLFPSRYLHKFDLLSSKIRATCRYAPTCRPCMSYDDTTGSYFLLSGMPQFRRNKSLFSFFAHLRPSSWPATLFTWSSCHDLARDLAIDSRERRGCVGEFPRMVAFRWVFEVRRVESKRLEDSLE